MVDLQSWSTPRLLQFLAIAGLAIAPLAVEAQKANTFKYVGLSGVSAQQLFLGRPGKVYIVDKTGGCLCRVAPIPASLS